MQDTGALHPARGKKHPFLIVLIHHLGGEPKQFKNHIEFLNAHGFEVYTYPAFLSGKAKWEEFSPLIKKNNVIDLWSKELNERLNRLPGKKVIFTFSFPAVSALLLLSKRKDITALICDGGPFEGLFTTCLRFFTHHEYLQNVFQKYLRAGQMALAFKAFSIKRKIKKAGRGAPKDFPILSLQGGQDRQAPPACINKALRAIPQARLTVCALKESGHLQGLKTERDFYIQSVISFLQKIRD